MRRLPTIVAVLLAGAAAVFAQATVRGVVTDPSGAAVPRARVVLGDSVGNAKLATTGKDGVFEYTKVAPGTYSLTIRAGLDTETFDNETLVVKAGQITEQNVSLQPKVDGPIPIDEMATCFPGFRPLWHLVPPPALPAK